MASLENLLEICIIILTLVYMVLMIFDKDLALHFGTWSVFLSWWELTLLLGRTPNIGIYIYLSLDVLKTLAVFFLLYLPILMGFAFTFHLLLPSKAPFADPVSSLLKILAMMIGELDFESNFLYQPSKVDYGQGRGKCDSFEKIVL